eukprot:TRINITY_DN3535_c0_g1_i1.p1 TRINITY_DN3535_c0_g1~~TRINITY_DN3535_c0_g1_i1.p1  ORF type:complete len:517 (+),score=62.41 TRINITY_DN3535_c0_g1_i1:59-1609(+)
MTRENQDGADKWSNTTTSVGSGGDQDWDSSTVCDRDDYLRSEASLGASILNLVNNTVGAGLFSLSWCLMQSTMITGIALMALMCVLNGISFILLAQCCELAGTCSYLKMMQTAFGKRGGAIAQICVLMYGCGSCISFVVLTGDFLVGHGTGVLDSWVSNEDSIFRERGFVMTLVAIVFFLPLSSLRNLEPLKYTSFVSFGAAIYATAICVWAYALDNSEAGVGGSTGSDSTTVEWIGFPPGVWAALPLVNVAYTCHYNAPRYYAELEGRSLNRWSKVITAVMIFVFLIYTTAAVSGYLAFGASTEGDVLKNFSEHWDPAIVGRLALASLVVFTFPMTCHFIRDCIIDLWYDGEHSTDSCPIKPYMFITVAIIVVATVIGVLVTKVEVILAYKGAIFGSCMVYIFPPLMYTVLRQRQQSNRKSLTSDTGAPIGDHVNQVSCEASGATPAHSTVNTETESHPLIHQPLLQNSYVDQMKSAVLTAANWPYTLLIVWGVATGILGVVITILKQAHLIASD